MGIRDCVGRLKLVPRAKLTLANIGAYISNKGGNPTVTILTRLSTIKAPSDPGTSPLAKTTRAYNRFLRVTSVLTTYAKVIGSNIVRSLTKDTMFFTMPTRRCIRVSCHGHLIGRKGVRFLNNGDRLICRKRFSSVSVTVVVRSRKGTPRGTICVKGSDGNFMKGAMRCMKGATRTTGTPRRNVGTLGTTYLKVVKVGTLHRAFGRSSVIHIRPVVAGKNSLIGGIPSSIHVRLCIHTGAVRTVSYRRRHISRTLGTNNTTIKTGAIVRALPKVFPLTYDPQLGSLFIRGVGRCFPRAGVRRTKRFATSASVNSVSRLVPDVRPFVNNISNKLRAGSFYIASFSTTTVLPKGIFTVGVVSLLCSRTTVTGRVLRGRGPVLAGRRCLTGLRDCFRDWLEEMYGGEGKSYCRGRWTTPSHSNSCHRHQASQGRHRRHEGERGHTSTRSMHSSCKNFSNTGIRRSFQEGKGSYYRQAFKHRSYTSRNTLQRTYQASATRGPYHISHLSSTKIQWSKGYPCQCPTNHPSQSWTKDREHNTFYNP